MPKSPGIEAPPIPAAAAAEGAGEVDVADPYGAQALSTFTRQVNPIDTLPGVKKQASSPWHTVLPGASLPRGRLPQSWNRQNIKASSVGCRTSAAANRADQKGRKTQLSVGTVCRGDGGGQECPPNPGTRNSGFCACSYLGIPDQITGPDSS